MNVNDLLLNASATKCTADVLSHSTPDVWHSLAHEIVQYMEKHSGESVTKPLKYVACEGCGCALCMCHVRELCKDILFQEI